MENQKQEYTREGQERIIHVADLIREIIRRLWLVIAAAVIFAALLGGYKYIRDSKVAKQSDETAERLDLDELEEQLGEQEAREVNNVLLIRENLMEQQEYVENSVLMQINAYQEDTVTLQYRIDTGGLEDNGKELLEAYESYINHGGLATDLEQKGVDLSQQYVSELITETADRYEQAADSGSAVVLTEDPANAFSIRIIHRSKDECMELAGQVEACMETCQERWSRLVGEHQLVLMDQSYGTEVDRSLWTYKMERADSITSMQDRIDSLTEEMSDEQRAVLDAYMGQQEKENEPEGKPGEKDETDPSVGISKKYVAVGGLCGILLACLYIIVCYVMRGTINTANDIRYLYRLAILGEVGLSDRKRNFSGIWNRLVGIKTPYFSAKEEYEQLVARLRVFFDRRGLQKVLFAGNGDARAEEWLKKLVNRLKEQGMEAEIAWNMLFQTPDRETAAAFDHVILVEMIGVSRYEVIEKELEFCALQAVEVAGVIVLRK